MPFSRHGFIDRSPMSEPQPVIQTSFYRTRRTGPACLPIPATSSDVLGSRVITGIVIAVGLVALTGLASQVTRQDQQLELASSPGSGIVVRSDVFLLRLPRSMFEAGERRDAGAGDEKRRRITGCSRATKPEESLVRINDQRAPSQR